MPWLARCSKGGEGLLGRLVAPVAATHAARVSPYFPSVSVAVIQQGYRVFYREAHTLLTQHRKRISAQTPVRADIEQRRLVLHGPNNRTKDEAARSD